MEDRAVNRPGRRRRGRSLGRSAVSLTVITNVALLGVSGAAAQSSAVAGSAESIGSGDTTVNGNIGDLENAPAVYPSPATQNNTYATFFEERADLTLPTPLTIDDAATPGIETMIPSSSATGPTTIPAGTAVNSYFIGADPTPSKIGFTNFVGTVTFLELPRLSCHS
jgi:hypothetical protein